jgi:hypothetical protein
MRQAELPVPVNVVQNLIAYEEMLRIDTARLITAMKKVDSFRERAYKNLISHPMRSAASSGRHLKHPVSASVFGSSPKPTAGRVPDEFREESLKDWSAGSCATFGRHKTSMIA